MRYLTNRFQELLMIEAPLNSTKSMAWFIVGLTFLDLIIIFFRGEMGMETILLNMFNFTFYPLFMIVSLIYLRMYKNKIDIDERRSTKFHLLISFIIMSLLYLVLFQIA